MYTPSTCASKLNLQRLTISQVHDEKPHILEEHFSFGVSRVAHGSDLVAHKDLQKHLDSQAREQAEFYIL